MPTFGFSAFLKLLSMNPRPTRTEVRNRLRPGGGGYDYHRSLRLRAQRYLSGGEPMADVLASVEDIRNASERLSARQGLEQLEVWRDAHDGALRKCEPVTFESPGGLFKVTFTPDFGIEIGRSSVAVHIWNINAPPLSARMVYAALSLLPDLYGLDGPHDFAVLSLRDGRLYRLSEAGPFAGLGKSVAARLEDLFREVRSELGLPPTSPNAPPP